MNETDLLTPPKILIVDDTPANLVAMRRLLRDVGATLIEAASGNEALAACLDHEFALILLDVQMPDFDGFEVASLLAGEARTRDTPIIFVTAAYGDDLNRLKGYRHGAVDYIAKPVNDVILLSKVRIFLDLYNGRRRMAGLLRELEQRNQQLEAEVAERKRLEELARHQAGHDALTGLPNRVLFRDRMEQAVAHAARRRETFALLYIDLDGFKPINDELGHVAGDQALRQIGVRLQEVTRQSDTCARLGGDEFAVIMDGATAESALLRGQKLCEHLRRPLSLNLGGGDMHQVQAGASIGAAIFSGLHYDEAPDVEGLTERLIRVADQAMYEAKRAGRNRCVVAPQAVSGAADQSR